jgi:hypothetical protein
MSNSDKQIAGCYQTRDYTKFKSLVNNRDIDNNHVRKLKKSMELNGWNKGSLVIVNERYEIIDGQHRFTAAQQVGVPISYSVIRGLTEKDIQLLNQEQKNWNKNDFVNYWAGKGNPNYMAVKQFAAKNPKLKITQHLMLLMNEPHAHPETSSFNMGQFQIADVTKAQYVADALEKIEPLFPKGCYQSKFVAAMIKVLLKKSKIFKLNVFLTKLEKNRNLLYPCTTADAYISRFQEIYNYYTPESKKINLL